MTCSLVTAVLLSSLIPPRHPADVDCQAALHGNGGNGSVKLGERSKQVTWYDFEGPSALDWEPCTACVVLAAGGWCQPTASHDADFRYLL